MSAAMQTAMTSAEMAFVSSGPVLVRGSLKSTMLPLFRASTAEAMRPASSASRPLRP